MSGAILAAYRVLDLSNEHGMLCGQILADLGADVIQIEPPGGSMARREGPFLEPQHGDPGLGPGERSLFFAAYARGKRGMVLDLDSAEGRAEFERLVAKLQPAQAFRQLAQLRLVHVAGQNGVEGTTMQKSRELAAWAVGPAGPRSEGYSQPAR